MVNPYEDGPSTEQESCDLGGCCEPWAWESDRRNGPRYLRLCEEHADRWMKAEREMDAEIEQMRGRRIEEPLEISSLFGLARAGFVDGYAKSTRRIG